MPSVLKAPKPPKGTAPKTLDYSKPTTPDVTERTLDYSKLKTPKAAEPKWKTTLRERRMDKHRASDKYKVYEAKGNTFVKSDLQKAEMHKKPFGTDLEQARNALESYEKKLPRMIEGIKNSDKKASEKNRRLAYLDRMHKYFQKGVEYASQIHSIKNDPTPPKPFFSADNAKSKKDGIISFNLPAGHSCPGKGECFGFCYAMQGPQSWPTAMKRRVENWGLAERPDFVNSVNEELKRWGKAGGKKMGDTVRIHDSGDFYSQDYMDKWHDIAKANPDKKFYAYTKALNMDWRKLHSLPNFTIIQSVGGKHDHAIDPELPHSFIFPTPEALKEAGYVDTHESDMPAVNAKNHPKIGLVIHGVRSKNLDPEFGKEFKGNVPKQSVTPARPIEKKTASLGKSAAPKVSYTPDVVKFDQPDQLSQLSHSPHFVDQLKVMHARNYGHGSHEPSMNDRIKQIKAENMDKQEPSLRSQIDKIKQKFYGKKLNKSEDLKKQDGATPPAPPATPMQSAASSIKSALTGGDSGGGIGGMISSAASAIKGAFSGPSLGDQIGNNLSNLKQNLSKTEGANMENKPSAASQFVSKCRGQAKLAKDDKPHAPQSPQDEAHDVMEEKQPVEKAIETLKSKSGSKAKIKTFFEHLRTLRDPSQLRSPANEAVGLDKSKSKWKPWMSDAD